MDWDKVRIFHAAAEAGSLTKAGDVLGLSQSAVSRQVSALEAELKVPLFHRHARGLVLTEQGELLFRTARELVTKLEQTQAQLMDSRQKPDGVLKVTANVGLGAHWLTPRLDEFIDKFPDIQLQIILTDDELDLAMREADVALRLREPVQGDLIRRKLFTVHLHVWASTEYLKRHGQPRSPQDLDRHRLLAFGGDIPSFLKDINWHLHAGRDPKEPREPILTANNITSLVKAVQGGMGIAVMPDYLVAPGSGLVQVLTSESMPELECYLVYAETLKGVTRVQVFRDFMVAKAQRWAF
ncbi:MAG TPA: LysR family transcriptional regulator [Beijerinckiaceae bacterium]|nr:LysR family transcriptional regulator [Beijerinckiaceae bacterium]